MRAGGLGQLRRGAVGVGQKEGTKAQTPDPGRSAGTPGPAPEGCGRLAGVRPQGGRARLGSPPQAPWTHRLMAHGFQFLPLLRSRTQTSLIRNTHFLNGRLDWLCLGEHPRVRGLWVALLRVRFIFLSHVARPPHHRGTEATPATTWVGGGCAELTQVLVQTWRPRER